VELNPRENAIFCLARGYRLSESHKFLKLIVRNLCLGYALGQEKKNFQFLIFHEGNISKFQRLFIKLFSLNFRIRFVCISKDFRLPEKFDNYDFKDVGYILMCRFYYLHVWKYLKDYNIAIRVDDDVFLRKFNPILMGEIANAALICNEYHIPTNNSLPKFLKSLGLDFAYNQKFPYTNFFITNPSFWLGESVLELLNKIGDQEIGIVDRWGDLPILGVILNIYKLNHEHAYRSDICYYHYSHRTTVKNGVKHGGISAIMKFISIV
jgi:hypothetical protein